MTDNKQIPVASRSTGETKFVDRAPAKPVRAGSVQWSERAHERKEGVETSTTSPVVSANGQTMSEATIAASATTAIEQVGVIATTSDSPDNQSRNKKKVEIETLEQFIVHAYSLKGRRIPLSGAAEKRIAHQPTLETVVVERLLTQHSRGDIQFAVPRQLLLVAENIQTYPTLRGAIRDFVKAAMLAHPLFANPRLVEAINHLPDAPPILDAMRILASAALPPDSSSISKSARKATQSTDLRANAVYCLAVWFFGTRGTSVGELNDALGNALWLPSAVAIREDRAKLRALTEVRDLAAFGVAFGDYQASVTEKKRQVDAAQKAASKSSAEAAALRDEIEQLCEEKQQRVSELERQVENLNRLIEKNQKQTKNALAHLRDDLELQRTHVLRRLKADVALLDNGLIALRRDPPKVHVMDDHAERAVDALRQEIKNLESRG